MSTNETHEHFTFSYKADCLTCGKYVSPKKRKTRAQAQSDADAHTQKPGNEEHNVGIQVTQQFHLF